MKGQTSVLSTEPGPSDWESSAPSTKPLLGTKVCFPILPYVHQRSLANLPTSHDSHTVILCRAFVPSNGLVFGALDSQSLGPGSMLGTEVCLFILPSSPELSEISIYSSPGADVIY